MAIVSQNINNINVQGLLLNYEGSIGGHSININAQTLNLSKGNIYAIQDLLLEADNISANGATTSSDGSIGIKTNTLSHIEGDMQAKGNINIAAQTLNNKDGFISSIENLSLDVLSLDGDGGEFSGGGVTIDADSIDVNQAKISSTKEMIINADKVMLKEANIVATKTIDITAKDTNLDRAFIVSTEDSIDLNLRSLNASDAELQAKKRLDIRTDGNQTLNNSTLDANNIMLSSSRDTLHMSETKLNASDTLKIDTYNLLSDKAEFYAPNLLFFNIENEAQNIQTKYGSENDIQIQGNIFNDSYGEIISQNTLSTSLKNLNLSNSYLKAKSISLAGDGSISIDDSRIVGEELLEVDSKTVEIMRSNIASREAMNITVSEKFTQKENSQLLSNADMSIDAKIFSQESNSVVNSGTNMNISTEELINKGSQIVSSSYSCKRNC